MFESDGQVPVTGRSWVSKWRRMLATTGDPSAAVDPHRDDRRWSEAYRRIVHELSLLSGNGPKVILLASAVEGEGTSTVARQLAAGLAKSRSGRVLLVDAGVTARRREARTVPLSEVAVRTREDDFDVTPDGFSVLPFDPETDRPSGVMWGKKLAEALSSLGNRFPWIIIDGRPITQYAETATLSSHADATVLVVQAESTRSEVAGRALDILHGAGAHVIGAVLNRRQYHIPDSVYRHL